MEHSYYQKEILIMEHSSSQTTVILSKGILILSKGILIKMEHSYYQKEYSSSLDICSPLGPASSSSR